MRPLSTSELLEVWEHGWSDTPVKKALHLLVMACPELSRDELVHLSIGQRDARLLTLRELAFGSHLASVLICPGCAERLEMTFDVDAIREIAPEQTSSTQPDRPSTLNKDGFVVHWRLPNSADLIALTGQKDTVKANRLLLDRCILGVWQEGMETTADHLPAAVISAVTEQMAQADPQADVQLAITCPVCTHSWQTAFDIVSFFWSEIDFWAGRILKDVHILASTYGWREDDILGMSMRRRQAYLELVACY